MRGLWLLVALFVISLLLSCIFFRWLLTHPARQAAFEAWVQRGWLWRRTKRAWVRWLGHPVPQDLREDYRRPWRVLIAVLEVLWLPMCIEAVVGLTGLTVIMMWSWWLR